MKNKNFMLIANNQPISEGDLLNRYVEIATKEPKSEKMTLTLYITCAAIQTLEQMGNRFPSQEEIDVVEQCFRRFNRRKTFLKAA